MGDTAGDTWLEIYGTASNPNVVNASQGIWPAKAVNWTNTKGIVWVSASFRWALKFWCLQSNCTAHSHSFPTNLHPKIYKSAQQGEKNTNICKASMELWGWLVGISSTHRYCTSKIVVKPKKKIFPRNSIKQKKAVCSDSLVLMPLRLTHEVPDVWAQTFGPWAQDWPKSPRSILGQVSEVLVHLPEANGVTKAIGATHQQHRELLGALRQLPGARKLPQGTPRNPKEPWPPKKKIRLQADLVGFGWVSWVSVTGMIWYVQNVWGLMELCRASFR